VTRPVKARLAAGETLFGTFLTLGSALAAESLGVAGFDWLLVDLEHGGGDEIAAVDGIDVLFVGPTAAAPH
jgi:2-keto-3-deoxy-L-rhamnonate aldolase RhmA